MNRLLLAPAVMLALAVWALSLPAASQQLPVPADGPRPVRGVMHVHTDRSDGSGSVETVAAAAARAGLDFVVVTDHGDATRAPDPPSYRQGVLVIDAVEISTDDGHVLALGLPQAPYPLGGEARDAVEDIARLGGVSIAAHPDSPREGLRWRHWDVPVDAFEWLNGDTAWRDEPVPALLYALLTYPVRPAETMARLLDRPDALLARWDARGAARRRLVAVAGSDAHARIGVAADHRRVRTFSMPVPGYESSFRVFSIVLPGTVFQGDARADARAVIAAIREGRVYSVVDAIARPGALSFSASSGRHRAEDGDRLPIDGAVTLHAAASAPGSARITLLRDGEIVAEGPGAGLRHVAPPQPAVYRVEVHVPGAPGRPPIPWILSNPIHVGPPSSEAAPPLAVRRVAPVAARADAWRVESSAEATGEVVEAGESRVRFAFVLPAGDTERAFAAVVTPWAPGTTAHDGIAFRGRADRPMRVSVQVRARSAEGERWRRSVYLAPDPRDIIVWFDEMRPLGRRPGPVGGAIDAVMIVVDTAHTPSGSSGRVELEDLAYVAAEPR